MDQIRISHTLYLSLCVCVCLNEMAIVQLKEDPPFWNDPRSLLSLPFASCLAKPRKSIFRSRKWREPLYLFIFYFWGRTIFSPYKQNI